MLAFETFSQIDSTQTKMLGKKSRNELIKRYVTTVLKSCKTLNYILDDLEFLMFIIKNVSLTDL